MNIICCFCSFLRGTVKNSNSNFSLRMSYCDSIRVQQYVEVLQGKSTSVVSEIFLFNGRSGELYTLLSRK